MTPGNPTPDPENALTVDDIPPEELPNGAATVLTAIDQFGRPESTALIDDAGFVRKAGTGEYYFQDQGVRARTTD